MKKVIIILSTFFLVNVKANDFYTDYMYISRKSEKQLVLNDLIKINEIKLYNNYVENKTDLGYQINPESNLIVDKNDFLLEERYDYVYFNNSKSYVAQKITDECEIRYLRFNGFALTATSINDIQIFYQGKEVKYKIINSNYNIGNILQTSTEFTIDLEKNMNIKDLEIKLKLNNKYSYLSFYISLLDEVNNNQYYINLPYGIDEHIVTFLPQNKFSELLENIYWNSNKNIEQVYYFYYSKYQYHTYKLERNYLNKYTEKPIEGYIIDKNDEKIEYDYYQREKITIKDEINNVSDLLNIIEYSSVPAGEIKISTNWKINQNGIFQFIINYKDYNFYQKININFEENQNIKIKESIDKQEEIIIENNKTEEISEIIPTNIIINENINKKETPTFDQPIIENKNKDYENDEFILPVDNDKTIGMLSLTDINNNQNYQAKPKTKNSPKYIFITLTLLIIVIIYYKIKSIIVEKV